MQMWFFPSVNVAKLTPKPKYPREVQVRKSCDCYLCGQGIAPLMYARADSAKQRAHWNCKPRTN